MSTIAEIEKTIESLSDAQVAELAAWLERLRSRRAAQTPCDTWLATARGAARPGVKTEDVLALTRGEE
jgi:cytochrome c553